MRIHHLNCGSMCPPFLRLFSGKGGPLGRGNMVCHCLLLETEDGLSLIDTGLGTLDVANPRQRLGATFATLTGAKLLHEETALAQVERLGFARSDVRHILPTHLDLDHAGGLPDFPDALVHVFHLERAAALARATRIERERYRSVQWAHGPRWHVHELGGERWFGFDSVRAVTGTRDEVLLVPLLGHTRGHCGIAVRGDEGWILHAGDAYFAHSEIHGTPPSCPPVLQSFQRVIQMDGAARIANQARLRVLASTHSDVKIVCAHDARELRACLAG